MRINQCWLATPLKHSGKFVYFRGLHNLKKYNNPNKPAIFYGLYTYVDLMALKKHKAFAIVAWGGSDVLRKANVKLAVKNRVKHIAISSFISADLTSMGIEHKTIPLIASPTKYFKPVPMGDEIYTYMPKSSRHFYGRRIVRQLKKLCKYKINIISSNQRHTRKKLFKIYSRCFCGLRLTPHDGVANTVIELGLMGRKCIYNGDTPNAIPWSEDNIDGILENIEKESEKIGTIDLSMRKLVRKYINVGNSFLFESYWK